MKVYTLTRKQFVPVSISEAWSFFSSPGNLEKITPKYMEFRIEYISGRNTMYAGQIVRYKVNVMPNVTMNWVTEITHVREPFYFVDEQRFGPYKWWHHQHHFIEVPDGTEIVDEVNYAVPFGVLGRLAQHVFVKGQLNAIFDYRYKAIEELFGKTAILKQA